MRKKLKLIRCTKSKLRAIDEIIKSNRYIVITSNLEEGVEQEIVENLNNNQLFNIYRRLRKRYFKRRTNEPHK